MQRPANSTEGGKKVARIPAQSAASGPARLRAACIVAYTAATPTSAMNDLAHSTRPSPVAEATCRYLAPALYDDEVEIQTWIETSHPRMVSFGYEMKNAESGALLAKGQTKHIFCGRDLKPARLPVQYYAAFGIAR